MADNTLTLVGNCSNLINWDEIILGIQDQTPGFVGPRQNWEDPDIQFIVDVWKKAGYKPAREGGSAEWHMFFSGKHFDESITKTFADFCGISKWNSAWISRIMPGQCAPWHVDLQVPGSQNPDRIHCHIDTIDVGHMLIVEETHLFNQAQGTTYRWSDPKLWHASFNVGMKPTYLFNMY